MYRLWITEIKEYKEFEFKKWKESIVEVPVLVRREQWFTFCL